MCMKNNATITRISIGSSSRVSAHGPMDLRTDFSFQRLWYVLSCLWESAYKIARAANWKVVHVMAVVGFFSHYVGGSLLHVRRHITVNKICGVRRKIKHLFPSFKNLSTSFLTKQSVGEKMVAQTGFVLIRFVFLRKGFFPPIFYDRQVNPVRVLNWFSTDCS